MKENSQSHPIITFLTDFGEEDPYVGAVKGVILSISPRAKLIDLSHNIQKYNILQGAFYLLSVAKYFPKNTIHLAIIDPGVGSERRPIIIETNNMFFVGPDNGILSLAAENDKVQKIVEIKNSAYFLKPVSNTFHGRDIFAPIAAHLANNQTPEEFGALIQDWIQIKIPEIRINKSEIDAEIIHIDRFGNIVTNISRNTFEALKKSRKDFQKLKVILNDQELEIPLCTSYNQVEIGEFLGIFGSTDFLEISRNQNSAADDLHAKLNYKLSVKLLSD